MKLYIYFLGVDDFLCNLGAFSWVSKARISTSLMKHKVDDRVHKNPPPSAGFCCLCNIAFSFCGKALAVPYRFRTLEDLTDCSWRLLNTGYPQLPSLCRPSLRSAATLSGGHHFNPQLPSFCRPSLLSEI